MPKFLGSNDEQTTCDCCGKSDLKKTVIIELDSGEIVRYGADCAAKLIFGNKKGHSRKVVEMQARCIEIAKNMASEKCYTAWQVYAVVFNLTGYTGNVKGDTITYPFGEVQI